MSLKEQHGIYNYAKKCEETGYANLDYKKPVNQVPGCTFILPKSCPGNWLVAFCAVAIKKQSYYISL